MYWRFDKGLSDGVEFYINLPKDIQYPGGNALHGRINGYTGKITQIFIEGFDWPSYHLPAFLLQNGKPDEVWIGTYRLNAKNSTVPFNVYLLYTEKGMLASYGTWLGKQQGEKIIGCIGTSPNLLIWMPEKKLTFVEARALLGSEVNQDEFKSISETTQGKMGAEQFYQQYKDIQGAPCIETDASLWPIAR